MGRNNCYFDSYKKGTNTVRKLTAILNEGQNVTKLGVEVGDEGGLRVRGNY